MQTTTPQHSSSPEPAGRSVELWRIDAVCRRTGISRSSVYSLIQRNEFPRSVPLVGKTVAWDSREVEDWIKARIDAARVRAA